MSANDPGLTLNSQNLERIEAAGIATVPKYDRTELTVGIVHFGVGAFHRAHQAMVVDRLLRRGLARDFAICGVGVLPQDQSMGEDLRSQDFLYTLMLKNADGSRDVTIIGSIVDFMFAPDDPAAVINRMASPEVRIVSLTVTEGGYNFNQDTGEFDAKNSAVAHDVEHPDAPVSTFGLVYSALRLRRMRGIAPFTVMSCDNIQENGAVAKRSFVAYARLLDPEFADWMSAAVHFPNSMVDRITPVTTDADRVEVHEQLQIRDLRPVVAEPFFQWVLEDDFPQGRPEFSQAGVQLVTDVEPYELMKLRLLNASHQAMCYFGYLAGYRYAHEATADPEIRNLLRSYMDLEGTPSLKPVPGVDLESYKDTLLDRFANSEVKDTLARLCAESSDRIPKWLLPGVRVNLAADRSVALSAAICASWARYDESVDEEGNQIVIVDRLASQLIEVAQSQHDDELAFLRDSSLFGDLVEDPRFTEPYLAALHSLWSIGSKATVATIVHH